MSAIIVRKGQSKCSAADWFLKTKTEQKTNKKQKSKREKKTNARIFLLKLPSFGGKRHYHLIVQNDIL